MINRIRLFSILAVLTALQASLYAYVVNPVAGTWANPQTLVIDMQDSSSAYFSLSEEDPEKSGIAYDGPVLIEMEGDVTVNVAIIDKDGNKTLESVSYSVVPVGLPEDEVERGFLEKIVAAGSMDYSCGEVFSIPQSLEYTFGNSFDYFETGKELSISKSMVIPRNLPCTVTNGKSFWRFIIKIHPVMTGLYTRIDVPFEIENWNKVTFSDRKNIYKIDESWWYQPKESLTLDRSRNHMISWQSVDYSAENMVKFFVMPPKPEFDTSISADGIVSVSFKNSGSSEGYKFGIIEAQGQVSELFDSLTIDTFPGDNYSGAVVAGIYYDSVYQGKMEVPFNVRKRVPAAPKIVSSAENGFSRSAVKIDIIPAEKTELFVSVAGPVVLDENYSVSAKEVLFELSDDDFRKVKSKSFKIKPVSEGAAAYKIRAYCVDKAGHKGKSSEYSVIIDQCNYYVNGSVTDEEAVSRANGSFDYPFVNFKDVIPLINQSRYVHVRVSGDVYVPNEKIVLTSNCQIDGGENARMILGPNTSFVVRNSSIGVNNMLMTLSEPVNKVENASIFQIERGVLYFNNVELSAVFGKNGTVVNADNSVINIENSGITSTAESYSCVLTAVGSKINVRKSRINTVAQTAVNFSAQGGLFDLKESECRVTGSMGRVAELFDTHSTIIKNIFTGNLKKGQGSNTAVFFDEKNYSVEFTQNIENGF